MQSSQYADHLMENPNTSHSKPSKKKLRFFSKSKSKRSDYEKTNRCYCEECMRTVVNQNNYTIRDQQIGNPYYYPIESQTAQSVQSLSTTSSQQHHQQHHQQQYQQQYPEEHMYMEVSEMGPPEQYVERIYPPPKQFPCECHNCMKKRGTELTTELLPLDTQIPLQMMNDSALLCTIL